MNVFEKIYRDDAWCGGSGPGSKERTTREYRACIERIICENDTKTILDYGCGDGVLASLTDFGNRDYIGVDVSETAVNLARRNNAGRPNMQFFHIEDPFSAPWKAYDMVLIKDVFQHLSFASIKRVMDTLKECRHLLITNDKPSDKTGYDIQDGGWRPLVVHGLPVLDFESSPLWKQTVHVDNLLT